MPYNALRPRALVQLLLCGGLLALMFASVAEAKTTPGNLRVVAPNGKTLAEHTQYTGTAKIKTDRKADCFGSGTGGSGKKVTVTGPTALGIIADAGRVDRDVKPLGISDAFDFGIALCQIGKFTAPSTGYWYLKVDHAASSTGGDQTVVEKGKDILWYLIEDFNDPVPSELEVRAPAKVGTGQKFTVKVSEYSDSGKKAPAAGAQVTGAGEPTDARGRVQVRGKGVLDVQATKAGSIPSNVVSVCAKKALKKCPYGYAKTIAGSRKADRIKGGPPAETIIAGGGKDRINITKGRARDLVKCGGGKDKLTVRKGQRFKQVSCERIVRKR